MAIKLLIIEALAKIKMNKVFLQEAQSVLDIIFIMIEYFGYYQIYSNKLL